MQIKEKLEVFRQSTIEVAERESQSIIREYQENSRAELEKFRKNKQIEMENLFQIEEAKIRRKLNRTVSLEFTKQKGILEECQQEKRQRLFEEVERQLEAYQNTPEYDRYLIEKIIMAKKFARGEEVIIYINPKDADKKAFLEEQTKTILTLSEIDFGGGIRAVIRSKNVLIDESFLTKTEQERNGYTF